MPPDSIVRRVFGYSEGLDSAPHSPSPSAVGSNTPAEQLKELSAQRYVSAYSFVVVYLGLGDKEEALRWLEQSYQDRAGNDVGWIRVDSLLDPLRGDPRFEALAEKIVPASQFKGAARSK